jgi:hypothetical protein
MTMASSLPSGCLLTLAELVRIWARGEFGSSTQDDPGPPKLVWLAYADDVD